MLSQEEQDAEFAASLVEQEARLKTLRLEEDERWAHELAERDQAALDQQEADADAIVWQMLDKEQREADQKKRDDETWFEREKVKHEEAERRRNGIYVCETCEGEFFDAKLMAQCSEVWVYTGGVRINLIRCSHRATCFASSAPASDSRSASSRWTHRFAASSTSGHARERTRHKRPESFSTRCSSRGGAPCDCTPTWLASRGLRPVRKYFLA